MQYTHPSWQYSNKVCSIIKAHTRLDPYQGFSFYMAHYRSKSLTNPVREIPVMISFDQEPINRLYKKSIDSHINQRLLSNFLAYFLNLTCFIRANTLCQEGNSISSATPVLKTKFLGQLPHRRERKLQFSSTGLIRKIKRSLKALIG